MGYGGIMSRWFRALDILWFASTNYLAAQAWVPPAGQGSISISYQRINNYGHILSDGSLFERRRSLNISLYLEIDYGVNDRFSLTAALPYVFGKYTDPLPPAGTIVPFLPRDACRCWHSGPQDFGLTAHYNLLRAADGAFSLTPSVSMGIPSQNYGYQGESALGKHLRETTVALDAGQRLDVITPNLFVQGRYSYSFVERPLAEVPLNRSNAGVEATYLFLKRRLATRGIASWQRTHGGLMYPGDFNTPERLSQLDRLIRANYFHAGGGFTYSFPRMDVFASYLPYVSGTQTHAGRALTIGASWPFEHHHRHHGN